MTYRNLADLLSVSAAAHPNRTAVVCGAQRYSYAELDAAVNRVAGLLVSRGLRTGEKVALSSPNVPQFTIAYYGVLKAGGVVVPLNVLLKDREIAYHLRDSEARAYLAFEGTPELPVGAWAKAGFDAADGCRDLFLLDTGALTWEPGERPESLAAAVAEQPPTFETVTVDLDDTAVILYTSGTTGLPKGAELRHRNMLDNALIAKDIVGADPERPDTYLSVLPLFHSFGQTMIQNGALAVGGKLVMLPRFDAGAALRAMLEHEITYFAGVPTMYWGLLNALDETVDVARLAARLRVAVAGGSALPVEIHREFLRRFGVTILEGYGLSETSPVASFARFGEEPRVGSIGVPIPGVEMKLIDNDWSEVKDVPGEIGEIAIKGHNVMKGYYRRPDDTSWAIRDGWFRTGDLARKDEDGFYFIVDRSKDMIIRGGFNVYPREIEEVLLQHPAVSLVAVIGVPHPSHGEEIKAFVVPAVGATTTEAELVAWARQEIAAYKYPRVVEFVNALPMTATGKILKRELS
ncbi:long-chain fatty acid--CoA ligase [Nocardioides marmoriginsengisoli]|uniref:Long-chain fatty acid--CoA ligase n=1 Tax=Nocardioides marmoriginsengisoli TaxID=661483 RepID=A0A3N0CH08_9ACTN|nr:long-chain fatty acid--CoA ligase [Nocardioides marmoriginsengisoli]RNL62737.1 long-chain fatty acid--CoA ligase [Nocardioides marmoriginsengisoli]